MQLLHYRDINFILFFSSLYIIKIYSHILKNIFYYIYYKIILKKYSITTQINLRNKIS